MAIGEELRRREGQVEPLISQSAVNDAQAQGVPRHPLQYAIDHERIEREMMLTIWV